MDRPTCNNCGMELVEVLVGWMSAGPAKQLRHLDPNEPPYYQCKLYATPVTPELGARGMRNLIGDRFYGDSPGFINNTTAIPVSHYLDVELELGARGMRNLIGDRLDVELDNSIENGYGVITAEPPISARTPDMDGKWCICGQHPPMDNYPCWEMIK